MGKTFTLGQYPNIGISSSGTPTTNYLPKFTGASTIGNSLVYDNGTGIGVGTSTLTAGIPLSINVATGNNCNVAFQENASDKWYLRNITSTNAFSFYSVAGGAEVMRLASTGNVGINTGSDIVTTNLAGAVTIKKSYNGDSTNGATTQAYYGNQSALYLFGRNSGLSIISNNNEEGSIIFGNNSTNAYASIVTGSGSTSAGGDLYFKVGSNTERMRITSEGNVLINKTSQSNVRFYVRSANQSSTEYAIYTDNSVGDLLTVRNDGAFGTGAQAAAPYNLVRTGRVMMVDSGGVVGYQASTRESKININNLTDISFLYQLNPVSFNYRKMDGISNTFIDEFNEDLHYGLIADEVEKVNPELVFYNEKEGVKELAGVEYGKLTAVLIKAIQELSAKVTALENK